MDHKKAFLQDADGKQVSVLPAFLEAIDATAATEEADSVVVLTDEQMDLANRLDPDKRGGAVAKKKFDDQGIDGLREYLYQKSVIPAAVIAESVLRNSDGDMGRVAEDLFELLEAKFPGEAKAAIGAKGVVKINARRKARGQAPL